MQPQEGQHQRAPELTAEGFATFLAELIAKPDMAMEGRVDAIFERLDGLSCKNQYLTFLQTSLFDLGQVRHVSSGMKPLAIPLLRVLKENPHLKQIFEKKVGQYLAEHLQQDSSTARVPSRSMTAAAPDPEPNETVLDEGVVTSPARKISPIRTAINFTLVSALALSGRGTLPSAPDKAAMVREVNPREFRYRDLQEQHAFLPKEYKDWEKQVKVVLGLGDQDVPSERMLDELLEISPSIVVLMGDYQKGLENFLLAYRVLNHRISFPDAKNPLRDFLQLLFQIQCKLSQPSVQEKFSSKDPLLCLLEMVKACEIIERGKMPPLRVLNLMLTVIEKNLTEFPPSQWNLENILGFANITEMMEIPPYVVEILLHNAGQYSLSHSPQLIHIDAIIKHPKYPELCMEYSTEAVWKAITAILPPQFDSQIVNFMDDPTLPMICQAISLNPTMDTNMAFCVARTAYFSGATTLTPALITSLIEMIEKERAAVGKEKILDNRPVRVIANNEVFVTRQGTAHWRFTPPEFTNNVRRVCAMNPTSHQPDFSTYLAYDRENNNGFWRNEAAFLDGARRAIATPSEQGTTLVLSGHGNKTSVHLDNNWGQILTADDTAAALNQRYANTPSDRLLEADIFVVSACNASGFLRSVFEKLNRNAKRYVIFVASSEYGPQTFATADGPGSDEDVMGVLIKQDPSQLDINTLLELQKGAREKGNLRNKTVINVLTPDGKLFQIG